MYRLMFNIIFNSFPKLITYLISKTWVLMSLKISSKVFFGDLICGVNWIGFLLVICWLIGYSRLAQFEWSGLFKSTNACDVKSFPCNSLIIWTKESCNCSYVCQLVVVFAFTNSRFLITYYSGTWLHVMTSTTTLTNTLSSLRFFVIIVVVVVGLVWNMLWTFVFLGQSRAWCSKLEHIIQGYFNGTLVGLTCCAVTSAISSTTLVGKTRTIVTRSQVPS
jgi:hypothetical protein